MELCLCASWAINCVWTSNPWVFISLLFLLNNIYIYFNDNRRIFFNRFHVLWPSDSSPVLNCFATWVRVTRHLLWVHFCARSLVFVIIFMDILTVFNRLCEPLKYELLCIVFFFLFNIKCFYCNLSIFFFLLALVSFDLLTLNPHHTHC